MHLRCAFQSIDGVVRPASLLLALGLTAVACQAEEGPEGTPLGQVGLHDSSDSTGKADALMGRAVVPSATEVVQYGEDTRVGLTTVTSIDDREMAVEAPLVQLGRFGESLQVTVKGGEEVDLRFLLVHRAEGQEAWRIITVEGPGVFEDGTEIDDGEEQPTSVVISYFQSISILAEGDSISLASDRAGGQTTTTLDFEVTSGDLAVLAIPVDSGWGNSLVGSFEYELDAQCDGLPCGDAAADPDAPVDDYAQARDVSLAHVTIGGGAIDYDYPSVDTGFGLGGTEFWQKWSGGHSPTYSYSEGTEAGRKCMLASAIRFEAIMSDPPESMKTLLAETHWSGRFFNWNDDYSESTWGDASGARLWAWRTGLIKWISQTAEDGSCYLPTRELVEAAAADCLARGQSNDGEIQGCQARG